MILGPSEKSNYGQNSDFPLPVIPQNELIYWYRVTICAHRVVYEKLIHTTVGTNMCAHGSITEYEHSHTTEGTESATLYQYISSYLDLDV